MGDIISEQAGDIISEWVGEIISEWRATSSGFCKEALVALLGKDVMSCRQPPFRAYRKPL